MRFRLIGFAILVGLLGAGLPLSAQAGQFYEYSATAVVFQVDVLDPASTARLSAAGINTLGGTIVTSTFTIDIATPAEPDDDMDPNTDFYISSLVPASFTMSTSTGPITLADFQRDNAIGVGLNQSDPRIPVDPFDSLGWAGSEPSIQTGGPAFLSFNTAPETVPGAGDGKGYLALLAGAPPQPDLAGSTALPLALTLSNFGVPIIASDWLDSSATPGNEAVTITAAIISVTVTAVAGPSVPALGPEATLVMIFALSSVAVWAIRRHKQALA